VEDALRRILGDAAKASISNVEVVPTSVEFLQETLYSGAAPLMQSGVSKEIWSLQNGSPEIFAEQITSYFSKAYPGFTVVRAVYPTVYLRDDRIHKKRK
jgi:hypothetical protein